MSGGTLVDDRLRRMAAIKPTMERASQELRNIAPNSAKGIGHASVAEVDRLRAVKIA